ncbi:probable ribosome-binding factor A, chloroplastic isoform X1 [Amborella trichopoda]|uniref:probable ribosome-binding factor A, chloroplastic isoform X1 n=1 Tax=Amborella trichopoda TaxID=13333 RepID=UPI0009C005B9|nr:probable ribosome-binding factor A, chloroplastic isoform X1 [Amborella trichopoda]|eukprot:XP_020520665.1 probable ribosome-binding factor A, chloroplastic isoform X1 [Amborella trichopoda]
MLMREQNGCILKVVVKVYVSVFGDERGKEIAIAGLKSKAKYIRSALGRRMKLRLTPEIRFIEDDSIERGSRVIAILDKLKNESQNAHVHDEISDLDTPEQDEGSTPSKSASVFQDKDWQEDEDDDVFYIDKRIGGLQP